MARGRPARHPGRVLVPAAAAALLLSACVAPAVTPADYRDDAIATAEAMVSVARETLLTADLAAAGSAPARYVTLRLSEAETRANSIITSFASVQPPSPSSDRLRTALLAALDDAAATVEEVRIAAYRGEHATLRAIARPLERSVARLHRFIPPTLR